VRARVPSVVAFVLAFLSIRFVHAEPPANVVAAAQEPDPGPRWGVSLGAGLAAGSFLASSLSRQLTNAGFRGTGPGFFLHMPLEFDVRVLSTIALGVSLDMQFGSIKSDRDEQAHGFHTVNALFLVRPSIQAPFQGRTDGVLVGMDIGAGGGTALWVVRGAVEPAPMYRLRTNMVVSYVRRGFGAGFRLGVQYAGAGPFGPRQLHMKDWSSFIEPRLEWRW
jgi:hypothetical protein